MKHEFHHERLDAYRLSVVVARWVPTLVFPASRRHLQDQLVRAADSLCLNIAEGTGRAGKSRRYHFRVAKGSAAEACAVLDLMDLPDGAEHQQLLRRVGAMLGALERR